MSCFVLLFIFFVSSFVTAFTIRFVAGSTQSECELAGFRLPSATAPPLPRLAVVTPPARLPAVLSTRFHGVVSTQIITRLASDSGHYVSGESWVSAPVCFTGGPDGSDEFHASTPNTLRSSVDDPPLSSGEHPSSLYSQICIMDVAVPRGFADGPDDLNLWVFGCKDVVCVNFSLGGSLPTIYVISSPACLPETLQGFDHLLGFGLYAESSTGKLSFKATTLQKMRLRFDTDLVNYRNVSMTSPLAKSTVQECGLARFTRYYVTVAFPSHYAVSSIDGSSQSRFYGPPSLSLVAVTIVQECGYARSSRHYITAAYPSYYAVSSIDGSSQNQQDDLPILFLVTETTVQECGLARSDRYYVTAAIPLHYAVSNIDGSSQSRFCEPFTRTASFYRESRISRSQNPLAGLFNVVFDFFAFVGTRALGLQVKLLYGSLLSLATSIFHYVSVIFVYQFTVENLSGCIQLSLLDL